MSRLKIASCLYYKWCWNPRECLARKEWECFCGVWLLVVFVFRPMAVSGWQQHLLRKFVMSCSFLSCNSSKNKTLLSCCCASFNSFGAVAVICCAVPFFAGVFFVWAVLYCVYAGT